MPEHEELAKRAAARPVRLSEVEDSIVSLTDDAHLAVEFRIADLVRRLTMPDVASASCGGCNGCSGCSM